MKTETKTDIRNKNKEVQQDPQGNPDITDIVDNMEQNINDLAIKFINTELDNPEDIYNNNGLFVLMLKYIYRYYLVDILKNNMDTTYKRYDYKLLNKIFWIYTALVYKYKKNSKPNIVEFSVFVCISRESIYNASKGYIKKVTQEDIDIIKTWFSECENGYINNQSVFDIFMLKSQYGYNDNLQAVPLELQSNVVNVDQLPDLSVCQNVLLTDSGKPEQ